MNAGDRIEQLEGLLRDDPEDRDLYFLLGKALLDAGRPAEAVMRLEEAVRRHPDHAAIYRFWGQALRDGGDLSGSASVWRKGIALAERTGDLQAGKEMTALLGKLKRGGVA
jgi:cytochrome c-type biogenesis protein CcmH/NrfG